MAASRVSWISRCMWMLADNFCSNPDFAPCSFSFNAGNAARDARRLTRSRALALPTSRRERMRSKSKTSFKLSCRLSRRAGFSTSSSTASCRSRIFTISSSGHSIQFFRQREPMEVPVKSKISSSVPRLLPSRMFLISSRFRMAVASRFMNCSVVIRSNRLIWDRSVIMVS